MSVSVAGVWIIQNKKSLENPSALSKQLVPTPEMSFPLKIIFLIKCKRIQVHLNGSNQAKSCLLENVYLPCFLITWLGENNVHCDEFLIIFFPQKVVNSFLLSDLRFLQRWLHEPFHLSTAPFLCVPKWHMPTFHEKNLPSLPLTSAYWTENNKATHLTFLTAIILTSLS